jgi:cupin 2 domain-containing protein
MTSNLFSEIPALPEELVEVLLAAANVRIERIVSNGHASPPGFWYDQEQHEWVVVMKGAARLTFEDETFEMKPGEFLNIPAHKSTGSSGRRRTSRRSGWRCIMGNVNEPSR